MKDHVGAMTQAYRVAPTSIPWDESFLMTLQEPTGVICMAVYQPKRDLLERQIASFQAQTIDQWTCVIGIDGADADVRDTLEELCGDDSRFQIHEYPVNVGFYRNFERILQQVPVSTPWVALSDQDDEWFPTKLERLIPLLGDSGLCFGQVQLANPDGADAGGVTQRRVVDLTAAFIDNQVTGSACLFRGELLRLALPFPVATDLAFHDHWLAICATATTGVTACDEPLQLYVQHGANVIGEAQRTSLLRRFVGTQRNATARSTGVWRFIRTHRWGWRVAMAVQLLATGVTLRRVDLVFVSAVATGRLTPTALKGMLSSVLRRDAPPARALGLILGAFHPSRLIVSPGQRTVE